jgi:hypothetical protein
MTGERVVTVLAGVPAAAAFHPDGDDVAGRMVVRAARLGIDIHAKNGVHCGQSRTSFLSNDSVRRRLAEMRLPGAMIWTR